MVNFQQVVYQCKSEDFCIFQSLGTLTMLAFVLEQAVFFSNCEFTAGIRCGNLSFLY